ncbi:hypothetical protein [Sporolactobacillus laevolacticus]|uniref:Rho termination factor N-terminal domain-containing protein n=1 Tax=Sporolactobacillus laevolacticus DSM 442 TaxID=1395513 RepID=V6IZ16_9BACL|nr:hypothetical protein [Sporolactobacillus laevolacticus]EST12051.1 hypothetical protein P343_07970 [Sporolactobacillus laevolacticus DSM 442]
MWVKNKRTGKKWFVTDEHGKKLLKDDDYETLDSSSNAEVDLNDLTVAGLKKRAADKEIENYQSMDKEALIKALSGEQVLEVPQGKQQPTSETPAK